MARRLTAPPGFPSTKSVVNAFSSGGVQTALIGVNPHLAAVASGALTANTLAAVLSLTGRGMLRYFDTFTADTTSRTLRIQCIVDGTTVFDGTSNAIVTASNGVLLVGTMSAIDASSVRYYDESTPIFWNQTLVVNIASSLTETAKFTSRYNYDTY